MSQVSISNNIHKTSQATATSTVVYTTVGEGRKLDVQLLV